MQDVKRTDTPSQQMSLSVAIRTSAAASETNRAVICRQVNLTVCPLFGTEVGGMKAALFSLGSFQQHVIIGNYFVFSSGPIHHSLIYSYPLSCAECRRATPTPSTQWDTAGQVASLSQGCCVYYKLSYKSR